MTLKARIKQISERKFGGQNPGGPFPPTPEQAAKQVDVRYVQIQVINDSEELPEGLRNVTIELPVALADAQEMKVGAEFELKVG